MDEKLKQVTYRIPAGLSDALDHAAEGRNISVAQFVREALEEAVDPKRRRFEYPGFTPQFEEFLAEIKKRPKAMVLLLEDFRGQRFYYYGTLQEWKGSLIVLAAPDFVPIPRHYIQGWYPVDDPNGFSTLAMSLARDGWRTNRRYF